MKVISMKESDGIQECKGVSTIDEKELTMLNKFDASQPPNPDEEEDTKSASLLQIHTKAVKTIKQHMLAIGVHHKADYILLRKNGKLFISDDQVEIFSRFAFPIAYTILCLLHWKQL